MIVLLLPHQDDEFGALGIINRAVDNRLDLLIVYVTDGAGGGVASEVRNSESIKVLTRLGVRRDRIWFMGQAQGSPDGHLIFNLDRMRSALLRELGDLGASTEIYSPAWEGGHQDHDACALLALELASAWSCPAFQFPLYNAYRTSLPFTLFNPIPAHGPVIRKGVMSGLSLVRHFRSQRRVFIMVAPFIAWHYLRGAPQLCQRLTREIVSRRPHDGRLLYERRGRFSFAEFSALMRRL
jgi:LmbE family N-acetylglucosaminyl deacetylase